MVNSYSSVRFLFFSIRYSLFATHHSPLTNHQFAMSRKRPMRFRIATLNLEQDHKRWDARRPLIAAEIARLRPDVMAFNEICVPRQTARILRANATELTGIDYHLVQQ